MTHKATKTQSKRIHSRNTVNMFSVKLFVYCLLAATIANRQNAQLHIAQPGQIAPHYESSLPRSQDPIQIAYGSQNTWFGLGEIAFG